jgi:hypothetical protein
MESNLPRRPVRIRKRAGNGATVLLLIVIVFQLTVLADTMGMKGLGRIANFTALLWFAGAAAAAVVTGRAAAASRIYLASVLLIIIGSTINIARSLSLESLSTVGSLLCWLAAIAIPFLPSFDLERAWKLFYRFMVGAAILALVEYAAVFAGVLSTTAIETQRGDYLKGILTLFYGLDDGSVHYRMYGLFAEPGTYAMYLLPAIIYAGLRGHRWSVALFLWCLYLTDSLGGIASLLVMGMTYLFWRASKRPVGLLVVAVVVVGIAYYASGSLRSRYEEKRLSATVREEQVTLFRENFGTIVRNNPFGLPLTELTNEANGYLGSNFEIYTLFVNGGVLACFGYILLFVWIIVQSGRYLIGDGRDPARAPAMICMPAMLLFVFQRQTIISYSIFAFLFAPELLGVGRAVAPSPARWRRRPRRRAAPSQRPVAAREPG